MTFHSRSPMKYTATTSKDSMTIGNYNKMYARLEPTEYGATERILSMGGEYEGGLGRCIIKRDRLGGVTTPAEDGDESSEVSLDGEFVEDEFNIADLVVTKPDVHLWVPAAKGPNTNKKSRTTRAKIKKNAKGGFSGITKSWLIPAGHAEFDQGVAYATRKNWLARPNQSRVYLNANWRGKYNVERASFKALGGQFDWDKKQWFIPEGAHLENFSGIYSLFREKSRIPKKIELSGGICLPKKGTLPAAASAAASTINATAATNNATAATNKASTTCFLTRGIREDKLPVVAGVLMKSLEEAEVAQTRSKKKQKTAK